MKLNVSKVAVAAMAFLLMSFAVVAQKKGSAKSVFQSDGYTFPHITMDRLIAYCDMDSVAFDSVMRQMSFTVDENIYYIGILSTSKMVFGKSGAFGTSLVWISTNKDISLIDMVLEKILRPSDVIIAEGFSFIYKNHVITLKSSETKFKYEEINIIDKVNFNKNHNN